MFMDDLKVYAESETRLEAVIEVVENVSGAMGMELGIRKCAVAHMIGGKEVMRGGVPLKARREVRELEKGEAYRYLGVQQRFGADLKRTKQGVEREYVGRTRSVWESWICTGRKALAQNTWAMAVLRYSMGKVCWSRSDARKLDRTTRKIMRQNRAHQYGASVARLYQTRAEGGRGLVSLEQAWETETVATALYLHENHDPQVSKAMRYLEQRVKAGKKGMVSQAFEIWGKYGMTDLFQIEVTTECPWSPGYAIKEIRLRQKQWLKEIKGGGGGGGGGK